MKERITKEKLILIREFLQTHPQVIAAYGYGSGVIPQAGSNPNDKKEIDLILIVEDILEYFKENLEINPQEFTKTSQKYFKDATKTKLEKGTPIVYLSHLPFKNSYFKTGVISKEKLLSSCLERTSSFVPFRLEKPCAKIECKEQEIENAIIYDRQMTLLLCLLMLTKDENTIYDLITKICSISYLGDFRVKIKCEDPNKIKNLVNRQLDYFIEDYMMVNANYFTTNGSNIEVNYDRINEDLHLLPNVIKNILKFHYIKEEDLPIVSKIITEYFTNESRKESFPQAVKGLQTVCFQTAFTYAFRKFKKGRMR